MTPLEDHHVVYSGHRKLTKDPKLELTTLSKPTDGCGRQEWQRNPADFSAPRSGLLDRVVRALEAQAVDRNSAIFSTDVRRTALRGPMSRYSPNAHGLQCHRPIAHRLDRAGASQRGVRPVSGFLPAPWTRGRRGRCNPASRGESPTFWWQMRFRSGLHVGDIIFRRQSFGDAVIAALWRLSQSGVKCVSERCGINRHHLALVLRRSRRAVR